MIILENITKSINENMIVKHCTLKIGAGEAVCLCGPSGIGKTTLLEIAAGLTEPDTGNVHHESDKLGCAFQDDALVPWLNALDNLLLVMPPKTDNPKKIANLWLERFGLSPDIKPPKMSGGMRRRMGLARAFAVDPDILLLDEPFAFLDERWQDATAHCMEKHRKDGNALLLVSHQKQFLNKINCRIVNIKEDPIHIKP